MPKYSGHEIQAEAVYEELSRTKPSQPKIGPDYLEKLRIRFLDTRYNREDPRLLGVPLDSESENQSVQSSSAVDTTENTNTDTTENTKTDTIVDIATTDSTEINITGQETVGLNSVTLKDFEDVLYANALAKRPMEAEQTLELMKKYNITPSVKCYTHLMDTYANVHDINNVISTFKRIQENNLIPTMHSYAVIIKAFVQELRMDDAFVIFNSIKKMDGLPQPIFSSLIGGCIKSNQIDKAWDVFDSMRLSYHQADEVTFSLMIHACAKRGETERALNLFEEMTDYQLYPTDVTFNTLIHACAKRPDYFDEAFSLLHQMQDNYGFHPDIITYNTLLTACARKGNLAKARLIFETIMEKEKSDEATGSLVPDQHTYRSLFWCYANYQPPSLQKTRAATTTPVIESNNALVEASVFLPKMPEMRSEVVQESTLLFNYMMNQGIPLTTHLLTSYLGVHVFQKQTANVLHIYDTLFTQYGVEKDVTTYFDMLRFCYMTKDKTLTWRVWEEYQDFLEKRRLAYQTQADDSLIQQKSIEASRLKDQLESGWTEDKQREMVILMANTLAITDDLKHSLSILRSHFHSRQLHKIPKFNEVQTVYTKCIQLEDEEAKNELVILCKKLQRKKPRP
ncbi:hypothetical protein BDF14DRAFT_695819 [Spinellus fusiger]|nr:hypothetical protein BDF14DRAFT_695819 [Spinellus fusiger]